MPERDPGLDTLLELNGQTFFIDERHWVKFVVIAVEPSPERPHGLSYSLTLHAANGERLVGFDNAHPVSRGTGPGRVRPREHDHRHRLKTVAPYEYQEAAALLADFWAEVDAVLLERGAIS